MHGVPWVTFTLLWGSAAVERLKKHWSTSTADCLWWTACSRCSYCYLPCLWKFTAVILGAIYLQIGDRLILIGVYLYMLSLCKRYQYISDRITSRTSRVLINRMITRVHVQGWPNQTTKNYVIDCNDRSGFHHTPPVLLHKSWIIGYV